MSSFKIFAIFRSFRVALFQTSRDFFPPIKCCNLPWNSYWRQPTNCQALAWLMPAVLGKGITCQHGVVLLVSLSFWAFSPFGVWKMAGLQPGGARYDSSPWASHRQGVSAALQPLYVRCLNQFMLRTLRVRRAAPLSPPITTICFKKKRKRQPSMPRTSTQGFQSRGRRGWWSYLAPGPKSWRKVGFQVYASLSCDLANFSPSTSHPGWL